MKSIWRPSELETVNCEICGTKGQLQNVLVRPDGLNVVECQVCGLAYISPRPKRQFVEKFYDSNYFSGQGNEVKVGYSQEYYDSLQASIPQPLLQILHKFGLLNISGLEVLEVGCATGRTLSKFHQGGAHVLGIEPVEDAAKTARELFGLRVINSPFEDVPLDCNKFDIVIALEVIEHLLSPKAFLEKCCRVLRPGGLMVISTPNYKATELFSSKWRGFHTSFEHLYFFDSHSLSRLAKNCGFENPETVYQAAVHIPATPPIIRRALMLMPGVMQSARAVKRLWSRFITHKRQAGGVAHRLWVGLQKR